MVAPFAGAWIEIANPFNNLMTDNVAPFAGAWIEIRDTTEVLTNLYESLPSRERGLKSYVYFGNPYDTMVAPFAGAWIEIKIDVAYVSITRVAPFAGAWIEIGSEEEDANIRNRRSLRGSVD